MAEFCKDCFKEHYQELKEFNENDLILSKEKEICEGCGGYKYTVDGVKTKSLIHKVFKRIGRFGD